MSVFPDNIGTELEPSVGSIRGDDEENVEEQKDDGKMGFCEIQWQQQTDDSRKFKKKNKKRLEAPPPDLSITNVDEKKSNSDDHMEIIKLTSPMRVRSPLGYKSSFNLEDKPQLSASTKTLNVEMPSAANIKTISNPFPHLEPPHDSFRKSSLLSLKSLSMSLRMLKNRTRSESIETVDHSSNLETIDETSRSSIFKMDIFEKNLKKFVSKSNEAEFQTYSDYMKNQKDASKNKPKSHFKNQKVYSRRSSMSDINESSKIPHPKLAQQQAGMSSGSSTSMKHEAARKKEEHKKQVDKTAEMLKEVRKRNMETSKRISAPRRISTAY